MLGPLPEANSHVANCMGDSEVGRTGAPPDEERGKDSKAGGAFSISPSLSLSLFSFFISLFLRSFPPLGSIEARKC